jgi:hypothetical protein
MAMYSAYFDESGHPDDSRYLVVAGAVADVDQWVHFEREWISALAPLGTRIFHAVDFNNRNPPFDTLSDKQADDLLNLLVGIVCRRIEKSVSQAITMDQYRAVNEKYVFAEMYGHPYPCAARSSFGKVEAWAAKHSIPVKDILWFLEDGAKQKGQLEWIAQRDGLPRPDFREKAELIPLQCGDLLAWCHNLYLTIGDQTPDSYLRALGQLAKVSNEWNLIDLSDPDRLPTILSIPLRDPSFNYKAKIIKHAGKKRGVVRYWKKAEGVESKIDRKTLVLPEPPRLSPEKVIKAAEEYDIAHAKTQAKTQAKRETAKSQDDEP